MTQKKFKTAPGNPEVFHVTEKMMKESGAPRWELSDETIAACKAIDNNIRNFGRNVAMAEMHNTIKKPPQ